MTLQYPMIRCLRCSAKECGCGIGVPSRPSRRIFGQTACGSSSWALAHLPRTGRLLNWRCWGEGSIWFFKCWLRVNRVYFNSDNGIFPNSVGKIGRNRRKVLCHWLSSTSIKRGRNDATVSKGDSKNPSSSFAPVYFFAMIDTLLSPIVIVHYCGCNPIIGPSQGYIRNPSHDVWPPSFPASVLAQRHCAIRRTGQQNPFIKNIIFFL